MRKVKLKLSYNQAQAFAALLRQAKITLSHGMKHDLDLMWLAAMAMLEAKMFERLIWKFDKEKTFKFQIYEGYALHLALSGITSEDELMESVRVQSLSDLGSQLPTL